MKHITGLINLGFNNEFMWNNGVSGVGRIKLQGFNNERIKVTYSKQYRSGWDGTVSIRENSCVLFEAQGLISFCGAKWLANVADLLYVDVFSEVERIYLFTSVLRNIRLNCHKGAVLFAMTQEQLDTKDEYHNTTEDFYRAFGAEPALPQYENPNSGNDVTIFAIPLTTDNEREEGSQYWVDMAERAIKLLNTSK